LAWWDGKIRFLIWVTVAPVPIIVLAVMILFGILAIFIVPFAEVGAIGVIFVIIPIVIIMVMGVIDADLNGLGCGGSEERAAGGKSSRQNQSAGDAMSKVHINYSSGPQFLDR
jgi:hypothetical protein